ncbi:MAG: Copper binding periplasmic protein CusF [Moraxellaceae bacterium]|jgi:Cu/Ag efflux protein CusF|nr:Copper binding periplasmic protein CusF [Moraxellaceae bacterium]MDF3029649.1 Copper binding periplasmic protein CusF [Moraxellaceae bacterium]
MSKKHLLCVLVLAAASGSAAVPAQERDSMTERALGPAEVKDVAQGTGVLKQIEADGRHVIMAHEPIPEMVWPRNGGRRMAVADKALLQDIRPGQAVRFTIDHTGLIRAIEPLQADKGPPASATQGTTPAPRRN